MSGTPGAGGSAPSLAGAVFRGAMVMFALRFAVRAVGLVSIMFTARLLTPADFGVIGTAAIVIGLFDILRRTGAGEGLIRLKEIDREHVETAWTINLTVCAVVSAGLFVSAPLAAQLLNEPRLEEVLRVMCFLPVIDAFVSPGGSLFMRNMEFRREFILRFSQKVVATTLTVIGAFVTRDYWGLVGGMLAGSMVFTVVSYFLYPFRPRLHVRRLHDFLGFSAWSFLQGLASYVALTIDEIIVRRVAPTEVFGLYHTSRDLSRVFVSEFVAPAAAALLPGLARLQAEPRRFARAARAAAGAGAIAAVACGAGVALTAHEVTGLLLGPGWDGAAPFLALAAVGGAAQTMAGLHRGILAAGNRADLSAILWVVRAVVLLVTLPLAGWLGGPTAVALAFAAISILLTLADYAIIFDRLGDRGAVVAIFARPVLAGLGMAALLWALPLPTGLPLAAVAAAKVGLGAAAYSGVLLGLWLLRGRPDGAESALLHRMPRFIGRALLPRAATT
ncbi:oligosaccharide flippase family protein [Roseomonas sp. CCTCC AB2023176]|uniref:oligosaccharide flippase family protein n=1 Tax=Roseomonas sp. CCTCC AB2023176 TaxID=3342640 RepID=UPI0035DAE1EB